MDLHCDRYNNNIWTDEEVIRRKDNKEEEEEGSDIIIIGTFPNCVCVTESIQLRPVFTYHKNEILRS